MIAVQIARLIANFSLFLDLSDEEEGADPDEVVEMMELMGHDLQQLDKDFLRQLIDAFEVIAPEYSGEAQTLVRLIPHGYYLEEAVAADDPVKLAELEAKRDAEKP